MMMMIIYTTQFTFWFFPSHPVPTIRTLSLHSTVTSLHVFLSCSILLVSGYGRFLQLIIFVSIVRNIVIVVWRKPRHFGIPNRFIFSRNTEKEPVKRHKTGSVPGKTGTTWIPVLLRPHIRCTCFPLLTVFWIFGPVFEGHLLRDLRFPVSHSEAVLWPSAEHSSSHPPSSLILSGGQQVVTSTVILRGLRTCGIWRRTTGWPGPHVSAQRSTLKLTLWSLTTLIGVVPHR